MVENKDIPETIQKKREKITKIQEEMRPQNQKIAQFEFEINEIEKAQNKQALLVLRGKCYADEEYLLKYLDLPLYEDYGNCSAHVMIIDAFYPNKIQIDIELCKAPISRKNLKEISNEQFHTELLKYVKEFEESGYYGGETK